jgi:hypothetical protein
MCAPLSEIRFKVFDAIIATLLIFPDNRFIHIKLNTTSHRKFLDLCLSRLASSQFDKVSSIVDTEMNLFLFLTLISEMYFHNN